MNRPHPSMNGAYLRDGPGREIPVALKEMLRGGLSLLWRGFEYARDLEIEGWEFAVERDSLFEAGLSAIDLRWLIARGFVQFTPTKALYGDQEQVPRNAPSFQEKSTSFILTKAGAVLALQVLSRTLPPVADSRKPEFIVEPFRDSLDAPKQKPSWDRDRKELHFGESVVKQFRWTAVNQETILMAFEEDGWPPRIDDPLPQKLNQDPKGRLHDTIKCLNRNHRKRLIRFSGDGTGEGVLWTAVTGDESDS